MDEAVRALSDEVGIAVDWTDAAGAPHRVGIDSLRAILAALGFPCRTPDELAHSRTRAQALATRQRNFITASVDSPLTLELGKQSDVVGEIALDGGKTIPITLRAAGNAHIVPAIAEPGYHRLRVADREITLAVAPARCLTLEQVAASGKMYGLAVQLYALRRPNDGGIGDTSALSDLVAGAAREGADAIALSPVHSLFTSEPGHYGPYSPSSRLFLNPLYADPTVLFGEARVATAREGSGNSTADDVLIDWPVAARTRYTLFRKLFDDFANELKQTPPSPRATDYREFVRDGGARLGEHALFEAAHRHHYRAEKPAWSWRDWPDDWRIPTATGIAKFSDTSAREIDFHMFMQWIATRTFSSVQAAARDAGMRIGLIADLAIGMSPDGSHAWSRQDDLLLGLSIGAPPDPFNTRGQDWGLTAFSPQALMSRGFEPFIATLRAAMRIAGGVRIDHVMGLTRLWLIPRGGSPVDGAYLRYPFEDLLRIVALESHRHGAIVIGEDLGTVPPEFRARAAAAGIAGMDVLWFQRDRRGFIPPARWRRDAVAMTTTHDLPTAAGWWRGADIETRAGIGLAPDKEGELKRRGKDRAALWRAYRKANIADGPMPAPGNTGPAVDAAVAFTAQSPAALALIPVEDILGLAEQPNLPGTIDEHPNWRRRLPQSAADMLATPQARRRLKALRDRK